jgi:hydroxymethylpyrimidine/phosphomethylpyrimidine kinase
MAALRTALSIAGSDPTGGAGIQADLQVFRSLGVHGASVITALTVQDSSKVHQVLPVFPSVVLDQLRVLLRDIRPNAVKIGMLATDDVARNVALGLQGLADDVPIVLDPILLASDGTELLERRAWGVLRELIAGTALVTPNLPEAAALTDRDTASERGAEDAARSFVEDMGAQAVLIKGGHRDGKPDDLLATRGPNGVEFEWLAGERIPGGSVHGTGCALSSAIAAGLAVGKPLRQSVDEARTLVANALRAAVELGSGARFLVYA